MLYRHDDAPSTYRCRLLSTGRESGFQLIPVRGSQAQSVPDDDLEQNDAESSSNSDSRGFETYDSANFDSSDNDGDDDLYESESPARDGIDFQTRGSEAYSFFASQLV